MSGAQRGFTLLEALVVLVLTALIATVLVEGIGRVADLRRRMASRVEAAPELAMRTGWFRNAIAATLPDLRRGSDRFRGDAATLSGITTAPLGDASGVPTPYAWRIRGVEGGYVLETRERADWIAVLGWREPAGKFTFLGPDGRIRDRWPTDEAGLPQLPEAILLQAGADDRPYWIVASILGAKNASPRREEAAPP